MTNSEKETQAISKAVTDLLDFDLEIIEELGEVAYKSIMEKPIFKKSFLTFPSSHPHHKLTKVLVTMAKGMLEVKEEIEKLKLEPYVDAELIFPDGEKA
tara:strand:- start:141 stop:437 length:297 start_codon:yes stop_codon:yes gene_type:complete